MQLLSYTYAHYILIDKLELGNYRTGSCKAGAKVSSAVLLLMRALVKYHIVLLKMIKNVSKADYYKEKRIPVVTLCRRLESEQPVRTHLIEVLPRLGTELDKIRSMKSCQNRINLELANALKIIHDLEYELEVMTERYQENEESLFLCKNEKKELERKVTRLGDQIMALETSIQKTQFNNKARAQSQKEQHYAIVGQYEKKIEELTGAYHRLKINKQKELETAEKCHQNSLQKASTHLQEFESSTQNEMKKLQKQLERVSSQNQSLRQKIVELQAFNHEHLQQVRKANNELVQSNQQIKNNLEHKILALQVQLDLKQNQNKQLFESMVNQEKKSMKETQDWIEERNALTKRQLESEISWKKSYDELITQKDKITERLHRVTLDLAEKAREIISLQDKLKKSEKLAWELDSEKTSTLAHFEQYRRDLWQKFHSEYQMKMNESLTQHHRELSQKIAEAIQQEQASLEQKHRACTQKYLQKIGHLEAQILQASREKIGVQETNRKLQFELDQLRYQLDQVRKTNKEQSEQFSMRINNINIENENRLKSYQLLNLNELEKINTEHGVNLNIMVNKYELKVDQLAKALQAKDWQLRNLEKKLAKNDEDYSNERMSFIARVQSFEVTLGKLRNHNQELAALYRNAQANLEDIDQRHRNLEQIAQQEGEVKSQLFQQLTGLSEQNARLKDELKTKQASSFEKIAQLEREILEARKKDSASALQIETLKKSMKDLSLKCDHLMAELKQEKESTLIVQKKLSEFDVCSQQKWKIIQAEFMSMHQRAAQQAEKLEQDLRNTICIKDEQIKIMGAKIGELQIQLVRERSQFQMRNADWLSRFSELEQENKKLMRSSQAVSNLRNDNDAKELTIYNLKKQSEKLLSELQHKDKLLLDSQSRMNDQEYQKSCLENQIQQKNGLIKSLNSKAALMEAEYSSYKEKCSKQSEETMQRWAQKNEEMRKRVEENRNLQKLLSQQANKYMKMFEEKKKTEARTQELQRQLDDEKVKKNMQKVDLTKKISQLQSNFMRVQMELRAKVSALEADLAHKDENMNAKDAEIKRQIAKITSLQNKITENIDTINNLRTKLDVERLASKDLKSQSQKLKLDKVQFQRKIVELVAQIQQLEAHMQKTQQQIVKIYEEADRRAQVAYEEARAYFEREVEAKTREVEQARKKAKMEMDEQREQSRKREGKINEEKQELYKQTIEKSCKITEITIAYEELGQVYDQVFKQLQVYKKKWNKMFSEFTDTNEQLSDVNFRLNDFRTEDKRKKKVIRQLQEVRVEKTERFTATGDNETPVSQHTGLKAQETGEAIKKVNAFGHYSQSEMEAVRESTESQKFRATLVTDSRALEGRHKIEPSLDLSVRQDWSSSSSRFSFKQ